MTKAMKFLALIFLLTHTYTFGQKPAHFKIDTARILANENLDKFVESLDTGTFQNINSKQGIPTIVKNELRRLTNGFSIANPGKKYRCCCTSSRYLPKRQLTFLAKSENVLVLIYNIGGFVTSTHLLMINFDKNGINDLWKGYGLNDVKNVDDIVIYLNEAKNNNQIVSNRVFNL